MRQRLSKRHLQPLTGRVHKLGLWLPRQSSMRKSKNLSEVRNRVLLTLSSTLLMSSPFSSIYRHVPGPLVREISV
jgi:hypothetical protein